MRVDAPGITIDLPTGWEAEVDGGAGTDRAELVTPRTHIANFALPPGRGDYGSRAVEVMQRGDTLLCLLEEAPEAASSTLHGHEGIPTLDAAQFSAQAMQRARPGQVGAQAFFRVGDRAFVLYAVLAERVDRAGQVAELNRVLAGISIH